MNERITTQAFAEVIGAGLDLLPPRIRERLEHVAWFTADPLFAGLHDHREVMANGGLVAEWPHHVNAEVLPRPADQRRSTVVLPMMVEPTTIVHEAAHALHASIDWRERWDEPIVVTTPYGDTNYWEAFAEAFTVWVCPPEILERGWYGPDRLAGREVLARSGAEVVALFEELAQ